MNHAELSRLRSIIDGECRCHISPPCNWCLSLDEDELGGSQHEIRKIAEEKIDKLLRTAKDAGK
jgi:hypothetical protein